MFKLEEQRSNQYKNGETRNTYELHQLTTTTEHQIPDFGQV